jgi:hypothetical protein
MMPPDRSLSVQNSSLGVVALSAVVAPVATAGILVSTNKIIWDMQTAGAGLSTVTESFDGISDGFRSNPYTASIGSIGSGMTWTATAPGGLYVQSGLFSTNSPADLTFTFSPGIQAVAGNFFATDVDFGTAPALFRVTLSDGTGYEGYANASSDFTGFYSTSGATITSLTVRVSPLQGQANLYPTVDNLYFGIPAPGVFALLGVAGVLGFGMRRR